MHTHSLAAYVDMIKIVIASSMTDVGDFACVSAT